jgi:DNA modification methylase
MIPARVALALQADGWWLRSDIIWSKTSCMPESVTDRPTNAHEHVFLLTKAARYFYDAEAVAEPISAE